MQNERPATAPKAAVIVTYARSLIALAIARSLARQGVEVIGIDDVDLTVLAFSKWAARTDKHVRSEDDDVLMGDLKRIIKAHAPPDGRPYVLMPAFDDAERIARLSERLSPHIIVAAPPAGAIARIHPKDAFAKTVTELGVPAPMSIVADDKQALEEAENAIGFPMIIKPADAVGGRGISKVKNRAALEAAWNDLRDTYPGNPVVQALSEGDDYCYGFLASDGKVLAEIAYRNLVSFPEDFGAGVVRETVDPTPFRMAAKKLIADTGWTGIGQLDFMWTGDETKAPEMIELNARFWANLDHAISSGVDFPALWFELATTGDLAGPVPEARIGHRSKLPGIWMLAAAERAKNAALPDDARAGSRLDQLLATLARVPEIARRDSDLRATLSALGREVADLREVDTAGLEADDPLIGLGGMFVLSSLLEHGELPPELKA